MFRRNSFRIFILVVFATIMSTRAASQHEVDKLVIEQYGLLKDFIEFLKSNLGIAVECIDDAVVFCREEDRSIYKQPKCILRFILQKKGKCNITNDKSNNVDNVELEELGVWQDFLEYLKTNLKIARECADDAISYCSKQYPSIVQRPLCIVSIDKNFTILETHLINYWINFPMIFYLFCHT
ncbi:uncharacterized protein LOC106637210 [Copidosoma floridanum]|uniref:uncharacterized protein LOC106637210 n=1 Tax=Copidosoma floridanum TaxID=29053 RepID=UPI000C6FBD6B|nr:uncharacterized protein LOC106637210 [Copidosoma floridanum]